MKNKCETFSTYGAKKGRALVDSPPPSLTENSSSAPYQHSNAVGTDELRTDRAQANEKRREHGKKKLGRKTAKTIETDIRDCF